MTELFAPRIDVDAEHLPAAARAFRRDHYVELTPFISADLRATAGAAVGTALDAGGRRVATRIKATGNSERRYRIAGPAAIAAASPLIPQLYRNEALRRLVEAVCGEAVAPVPYAPEEFIATRFDETGDTHGWHWDDYAFALVWVIEAPDPARGGSLEFVRDVAWNKSEPDLARHLAAGRIERRHPASGCVYLLRSDTTLHRVTPLASGARREILCFSYAAASDLERDITHETIEELYDVAGV